MKFLHNKIMQARNYHETTVVVRIHGEISSTHCHTKPIQSGAAGFDTGKGEKLGNSQVGCHLGLLGWCLVSLFFRWQILWPHPVNQLGMELHPGGLQPSQLPVIEIE